MKYLIRENIQFGEIFGKILDIHDFSSRANVKQFSTSSRSIVLNKVDDPEDEKCKKLVCKHSTKSCHTWVTQGPSTQLT